MIPALVNDLIIKSSFQVLQPEILSLHKQIWRDEDVLGFTKKIPQLEYTYLAFFYPLLLELTRNTITKEEIECFKCNGINILKVIDVYQEYIKANGIGGLAVKLWQIGQNEGQTTNPCINNIPFNPNKEQFSKEKSCKVLIKDDGTVEEIDLVIIPQLDFTLTSNLPSTIQVNISPVPDVDFYTIFINGEEVLQTTNLTVLLTQDFFNTPLTDNTSYQIGVTYTLSDGFTFPVLTKSITTLNPIPFDNTSAFSFSWSSNGTTFTRLNDEPTYLTYLSGSHTYNAPFGQVKKLYYLNTSDLTSLTINPNINYATPINLSNQTGITTLTLQPIVNAAINPYPFNRVIFGSFVNNLNFTLNIQNEGITYNYTQLTYILTQIDNLTSTTQTRVLNLGSNIIIPPTPTDTTVTDLRDALILKGWTINTLSIPYVFVITNGSKVSSFNISGVTALYLQNSTEQLDLTNVPIVAGVNTYYLIDYNNVTSLIFEPVNEIIEIDLSGEWNSLTSITSVNANNHQVVWDEWIFNAGLNINFTNSMFSKNPSLTNLIQTLRDENDANPAVINRTLTIGNILVDIDPIIDTILVDNIAELVSKGWTITIVNYLSLIVESDLFTGTRQFNVQYNDGGLDELLVVQENALFPGGWKSIENTEQLTNNNQIRFYHTNPTLVQSLNISNNQPNSIKYNKLTFINNGISFMPTSPSSKTALRELNIQSNNITEIENLSYNIDQTDFTFRLHNAFASDAELLTFLNDVSFNTNVGATKKLLFADPILGEPTIFTEDWNNLIFSSRLETIEANNWFNDYLIIDTLII